MSELVKLEGTLTRNGVTVELYEGEFGKLSKENKGLKFPYPILSLVTFDRDVTMIGKEFISESMTKSLRRIFGQIQVECWDKEAGEVNLEQWQEMAADFTEGEEKRDILQAKKDALSDRFAIITEGDDFMANPDRYTTELKEIGDAVTAINTDLNVIKIKIDEKTAKRNATKAKNALALAERQEALKKKKEAIENYAKRHNIPLEVAKERLEAQEETAPAV
jgi:hypothetical protein